MKRTKIGFFGGSFDPPHFGHIALVCSLVEALNLDLVYIVPSKQNPLKDVPFVSSALRLEMTKLAFKDVPHTQIIEYELSNPCKSYTVDTIKWLMEQNIEFRNAERFLLLGDDLIEQFDQWKNPSELLSLVTPVSGKRNPLAQKDSRIKCIETPVFEISSTMIRKRLVSGLYCGYLLPKDVFDLICKNKLYGYGT